MEYVGNEVPLTGDRDRRALGRTTPLLFEAPPFTLFAAST